MEKSMEIFRQLSKKGYKHYYEGTIEELDSMDKDNQHLYSEIMHVVMWLYEKYGIWIYTKPILDEDGNWIFKGYVKLMNNFKAKEYQTKLLRKPTEAYEAAIKYCLKEII